MDFRLTEDQATLVEGVRDFLAKAHGPAMLRNLEAEGGRSDRLWEELVALGLTGLLVPEAQGGLGLGLVEAATITVELGRAAVVEPIVDTAFVAVPWLVARGRTDALAAIATGTKRVALAHRANPWVADLDRADLLIANGDLVPPPEEAVPLASIDPLRRLFAAPTSRDEDSLLLDLAALMSAAQLVGIAEAMLKLAVEYAATRRQFGQPIGSFQAVKHHLASAAVQIAFARPVLLRAAVALDAGAASAPVHVSHAKVAAGDTAVAVAEAAIQVHGAMGYTYEVDLHFWMKRAWALAGAWGDRGFHLARIDHGVLGGALAIGPSHGFD